MGLDLSVEQGDEVFFGERMSSYSGFHEFRVMWAQLLGFELEEMQGFGKGMRPWTNEPLQCFFDHSDCEGEISWQDAEQLFPHHLNIVLTDLLIALLHAVRLLQGWQVTIGGAVVPLWVSWIGLAISEFLAYEGFLLWKTPMK